MNFGFLQHDASLLRLFLWRKKKADLHAVLTLTIFGLEDQKCGSISLNFWRFGESRILRGSEVWICLPLPWTPFVAFCLAIAIWNVELFPDSVFAWCAGYEVWMEVGSEVGNEVRGREWGMEWGMGGWTALLVVEPLVLCLHFVCPSATCNAALWASYLITMVRRSMFR